MEKKRYNDFMSRNRIKLQISAGENTILQRKLADGSFVVNRPPHHEIAHFIGSSRETVSRALKELEHEGLIKVVGKKVILYRLKP